MVTTLGGLLSGILVYSLAPEAEGHGTDAAVEAFHFKGGKVRPIVPFVKAIASALTIGSGGAAGREGPTAQISVGLGSILADGLGLDDDERRFLVLAGMAAGLSAIFRSPLGMAIFATEVLYSGMAFEADALLHAIVAAVVAYAANGIFVGWSPLFLLPEGLHFTHPIDLVGYGALGIVAGVVGALEPTIFYGIRDLFARLRVPNHVKPAIGGLLLGGLAVFVPESLGSGYGWVQRSLTADYVGWSLILLAATKILAMSFTISSGGSGGIFGPNVYVGGMLGAFVAFGVDTIVPGADLSIPAFTVVGMAAVFAGAARVPLATLIMVAEMTGGYGLIVPAMLSTAVAFTVQQALASRLPYPSLYEAQVADRSDSPAHHPELVRAAFGVLERDAKMDLTGMTLPQLVTLLRRGTRLPIHDGREEVRSVGIEPDSFLARKDVAEAFRDIPDLVAVALVRDGQVILPRGSTVLEPGDHVLVAASQAAHESLSRRLETKGNSHV